MSTVFHRVGLPVALTCLVALVPVSAETVAPPKAPKPKAAAVKMETDATDLSAGFWTDWRAKESSAGFVALKKSVWRDEPAKPEPVAPVTQTQRIVDVAISDPAKVAQVLTAATGSGVDANDQQALASVVNMVASPKTQDEAAPMVAPEIQAQVQAFRANLSSGIPGLPGIYLGDNAETERGTAPVGYAPVAGGSAGCPSR